MEQVYTSHISNVLIDRTPIRDDLTESEIRIQTVTSRVYKASFPIRIFSRNELNSLFGGYLKIAEFASGIDPQYPVPHRVVFFTRKDPHTTA